jgi:hypothetical protein
MTAWPPMPRMARAFAATPTPENRSSATLRMSMSGCIGSFLAMTTQPCHQNSCSHRGTTYPTRSPRTCRVSGDSTTSHQTRPVTPISRTREPQRRGRYGRAPSRISGSSSEFWMVCDGCESAAGVVTRGLSSDLKTRSFARRRGGRRTGQQLSAEATMTVARRNIAELLEPPLGIVPFERDAVAEQPFVVLVLEQNVLQGVPVVVRSRGR